MIRRAMRIVVAVLLAYLIQSTVLPHLKIGGRIIDLIVITGYTIGYASGFYAGLTAGLLSALIMEVIAGDLPGLTAALCFAVGAFGAWSAVRIARISFPGKRTLEQLIRRLSPILCVAAYVMLKETLYLAYFYLTGMDVSLQHISKVLLSGLIAGVFAAPLIPLLSGFLLRRPEDTFLAKWLRRQTERAEARQRRKVAKAAKAKSKKEPVGLPTKGGLDA